MARFIFSNHEMLMAMGKERPQAMEAPDDLTWDDIISTQGTRLKDDVNATQGSHLPCLQSPADSAMARMDENIRPCALLDDLACRNMNSSQGGHNTCNLEPSTYDEQLDLAIALSMSEHTTSLVEFTDTTMGAIESAPLFPMALGSEIDEDTAIQLALLISNEARPRCFVCGARTDYPVKLRPELECPHIACGALSCRELLHTRWLDIRNDLMDGDKWLQDNSSVAA